MKKSHMNSSGLPTDPTEEFPIKISPLGFAFFAQQQGLVHRDGYPDVESVMLKKGASPEEARAWHRRACKAVDKANAKHRRRNGLGGRP